MLWQWPRHRVAFMAHPLRAIYIVLQFPLLFKFKLVVVPHLLLLAMHCPVQGLTTQVFVASMTSVGGAPLEHLHLLLGS